MDTIPISELKRTAGEDRIAARLHAQIDSLNRKDASNGKPFFEIVLVDSAGKITLRAWNDTPAFSFCEQAKRGDFIEVSGEFSNNAKFGLDAARWTARHLRDDERETLLAGDARLCEKQAADFAEITRLTGAIVDPRIAALCAEFLAEFGERFRRAAAARNNHHARRGGLVEHVAQMMRAASAICDAYPSLNRDLMIAGVLFHDCGKMWENQFPADGFTMPYNDHGELLGHITIGIELVNTLWRKIASGPNWNQWLGAEPATEEVRLHLLHLLAAHHGQLEFGSPVVPKTPEAWALHYVDNLDAKLEMMAVAYANAKQLSAHVYERVWPLPGNPVAPLPVWPRTGG